MSRKADLRDVKRRTAEAQLSALPMPRGESGWARDVRAKARARLLDVGAPARRDEYWKYTDPTALTAPLAPAPDGGEEARPRNPFAEVKAPLACFAGGRLRVDGSDPLGRPGLAVSPLADTLAQDISIAAQLFGVLETRGQEKVGRPLAILNTAAAGEGLTMQATGDASIRLAYGETASMVRHLVRVESGATLTILESGAATNAVIEADLADGACLHHVRVQASPAAPCATHLFARLGADSEFKTFTLTSDGALTRNEIVIELAGDNASGHVAGAVLVQDDSHVDNTVFVTHGALDGESRQVFKNVLAGQAKSIFQGKIFVREGAQKTDGYQISQAVLLNDGPQFSAKPELEIYADDVACSHGSTTGALDPTALFYLRTRGVPKADAEAMLIAAFTDEAIAEIADPALAEIVRGEVARWMASRA